MSGIHGKLKGKKWSVWTEEVGPITLPGESGRGASSPLPPTEDVMKLPREDMHSYGQCPIWDRFILVTCEKCSRKVKIESLESHVMLRHGSKSERNAYHKVLAARASSALKACQVKLTPMNSLSFVEDKKSYSDPPDVFISGSSSSTSPMPVSYPSTPPQFRVSSLSPLPSPTPPLSTAPSIQPADSASAPETRSPSPELLDPTLPGEVVEQMDVDAEDNLGSNDVEMAEDVPESSIYPESFAVADTALSTSSSSVLHSVMNYVSEEADSTTHNVISIPDSDDIPNIEIGIISGGQVMDSINTKYNVSILKTEAGVGSSSASRPMLVQHQTKQPQLKPVLQMTSEPPPPRPSLVLNPPVPTLSPQRSAAPISLPPRPSFQQQLPTREKMEVEHGSAAPTHYITVSPLSKGSPKKPMVIKASMEKKPSGREREYDPNKHCGVWDADAKRNCTRSLTCKSHSVYLKRKVINRSGPFDELLAAHKAEKEASMKFSEPSEFDASSSILARRLQQAPGNSQKLWDQTEPNKQSSLLKSSVTKHNFFSQSVPFKDNYYDENLHYTSDHPKPLAVCTFGGKRIGGLFIADRSRFLTRKVVKIAIATSGIQRMQNGLKPEGLKRVSGLLNSPTVARQQSLPYIVNLQGGGGVTRVGLAGTTRVGTLQIGTGPIQTQHFLVQDAFKTDIQDFKGGIKFELGRNIHHVIPSTDSSGGPG